VKHELRELESRQAIERQFHDHKAASGNRSDRTNFYLAGGLNSVWQAYLASAGDMTGKRILDFGCGEGWSALEYARRGATVHSFDISIESLRNLMEAAQANSTAAARLHPAAMAAEQLGYANETFDLVLGVGILHHTDLNFVGPEIARVLRPGGRAIFMEPLAHNPLLQLFRLMTPSRRTPTERPLKVGEIRTFGRAFETLEFQGYHLLSIFPQGLLWATGSRWLFDWTLRLSERLDRWILRALPVLQRYTWSAIIEVRRSR
jgi:2-polyprenyl-3-methyl-5-hydroxy-6-metoxy-1,4-benzoquinol methylase